MQRGLFYMGANNVMIVRVGFTVDSPLMNNDVSPADKTSPQICANYANMATAATKWDMNELTGVNSWYQSGTGTVYADRWTAAIEACQRYYKNISGRLRDSTSRIIRSGAKVRSNIFTTFLAAYGLRRIFPARPKLWF